MRIAFVALSAPGHLNPTTALARQLRSRNHEVVAISLPDAEPHVRAADFVGIAAGALDEILRVANSGRQQFMAATPMRDSELFQAELGRIEADLNAARAYLQVQAANHWSHALNGTLEKEPFLTQTSQTAAWLGTTCVRVANDCFALGGSKAVYESSLLQRRLRDLLTASQHMIAQKRQYVASGKLLLEPTWHIPRDFSAAPASPA